MNGYKEVSLNDELRKCFGHEPDKYEEFKDRYKVELKDNKPIREELDKLKQRAKERNKQLTLLFGMKNEKHYQAVILKEILDH